MSNEMYQFDIGTPGAKQLDAKLALLSVDKFKAKLDELGVPQMPDDIRARLEPKVNHQYELGQQLGESGDASKMTGILQRISSKFEADLLNSIRRGEKLTSEEYFVRMLELTDEISEAMEKVL